MRTEQAARILGVEPPAMDGVSTMRQAQEKLQAWKDEVVQAAWKRELRKHHPDRAVSLTDEAERTQQTVRINRAREVLRQLRVRPKERPTHVRRVVIFGARGTATTSGY